MSIKLRELIRQVRQCKTAAEERGVIAKECALIRTAFKEKANEDTFRHRNVAKLLYIHMLGYPTHFGQIESLKLIASPKFPEKRIGYLGLMVLLDEKQEVLVLATSSMRNDFKHQNPYVVGLALCSLGNISSVDIARDLASEIEKLCRHPNPYIRKKAATCAIRVIRKCPELIDDFVSAATELLNDRNHAVLLSGVQLIIEMIRTDGKHVKTFRPLVGTCVKLLRNLVMAGYVSEYDVCGITDPFLQCKLIQLMRLLGTGDKEASDTMNDILAQVAINTEPTKNPGNAILYECVMTIMSIEAESGLRVLAINILGRFLLNRDNNIRYVALQTLCKCVSRDTQAIQRHRNTVVDCLKDADISIRRRALDLIYALVTKANVKPLVKELLNYLALAAGDVEFKSDLTDKICLVVEKFAPNKLWHIETIVAVLNTAGNFTREAVAIDLIYLIARTKELHAYSVHKIFQVLNNNKVNQLALINVGAWAIGEYGDLLVTPQGLAAANVDTKQAVFESAPTEAAVLSLLARFVKSPEATIVTKEYVLNALAKLSARFKDVEAVKKMMATYSTSMSAELQQRSVEYIMLAGEKLTKLRSGVVARMPVLDAAKRAAANGAQSPTEAKALDEKAALPQAGEKDDYEDDDDQADTAVPPKGSQLPAKAGGKGVAAAATPSKGTAPKQQVAASPAPVAQAPVVQAAKPADPFDVIFGGGGGGATAVAPAVQQQKKVESDFDPLASMFMAGGGMASPAKPAPAAGAGAGFGGGMASLLPGFGAAPAPVAAAPAPVAAAAADPFGGMFGPAVPAAAAPVANGEQTFPAANVFSGGGLSVEFVYSRNPSTPAVLTVKATSRNSTGAAFDGFDLKIAVPKYVKLTIAAASSATVAPNNGTPVTQTLTLENTLHGQKPLLVRAKIVYSVAGAAKEENVQISNFPA